MRRKLIFIGGIIQGSARDKSLYPQDYRKRIAKALREVFKDYEIYDPVENHPNCADYTDEEAKKTFLYHVDLVKHAALVVVFLPEASMGTAIEMWEAYKSSVPVWAITPMRHNWVVRITASKVFESIEEFEKFLRRERSWIEKNF